MDNIFLLRYDTECTWCEKESMDGFFEKVIEVHRSEDIPATFFCTGNAIDHREDQFSVFYQEIKDDPLFDIQDHSYSHIGIGYVAGMSVEDLKADYSRSFDAHQRVFGVRPRGVSICGTGGKDGESLEGFDQTEKGREELDMLAGLGLCMINSHLTGVHTGTQFCNYASIGHPDIMGFPSGFSDTGWNKREDGIEFVCASITEHAQANNPMPLMLHDWVAWNHVADQELTHVKIFAEHARKQGYELKTHIDCYQNPEIWQ